MRATYQQLKRLYEKYERVLIPGMLIFGVIADFITFRTINIQMAFTLLSVYLVIAGVAIAYVNVYDAQRIESRVKWYRYARLAAPLVIQFTFGALLSASLIFYWFSGALSVSWPFLVIIAALMASNDVLRHYFLRPVVQIGVYFFVAFSLFSLIFPYALNSISAGVFMFSGIAALAYIGLYFHILKKLLRRVEQHAQPIFTTVFSIFLIMTVLYFLNVIPPIPLSLREAGVYHGIERSGSEYLLIDEHTPFLERLIPGQTIHIQNGSSVFVFSSIFAPAKLDTTIVHHWQFFDEEEKAWVTRDKLAFNIFGGREDGFRGFSQKSTTEPGKWRVRVETKRGQVLGRIRFKIDHVEETPELEEIPAH